MTRIKIKQNRWNPRMTHTNLSPRPQARLSKPSWKSSLCFNLGCSGHDNASKVFGSNAIGGKTAKLKFIIERKNKFKGEETKDEFTSAIPKDLQHLNMI